MNVGPVRETHLRVTRTCADVVRGMNQPSTIAILEDDLRRVGQMVRCLRECVGENEVVVFDNAPDMIAWLAEHLESVKLFCLDHDLGANLVLNGEIRNPGTGRDVADCLSSRRPVCPVVIHSSNVLAAPGMMMVLEDAGWTCSRLAPFNDLEWVREAWIDDVRTALGKR
jgi:hypothetical protein